MDNFTLCMKTFGQLRQKGKLQDFKMRRMAKEDAQIKFPIKKFLAYYFRRQNYYRR